MVADERGSQMFIFQTLIDSKRLYFWILFFDVVLDVDDVDVVDSIFETNIEQCSFALWMWDCDCETHKKAYLLSTHKQYCHCLQRMTRLVAILLFTQKKNCDLSTSANCKNVRRRDVESEWEWYVTLFRVDDDHRRDIHVIPNAKTPQKKNDSHMSAEEARDNMTNELRNAFIESVVFVVFFVFVNLCENRKNNICVDCLRHIDVCWHHKNV